MTPHTVHTAGLLLPLSLVFKLAERDVSGCVPGKGREGWSIIHTVSFEKR